MLPFDRKQKILDILKKRKNISVEELVKILYCSPATIRRDLMQLSEEGLIRRIRGGATYIEKKSVDLPYHFRNIIEQDKKKHIAELALDFIANDMTLFMDSSTTVLQLVPYLKDYSGLKILTNGTITAQLLSENLHIQVTCVGGRVHPRNSSINGAIAYRFISNFHAELALLSAKSLSKFGAMEFSEEEAIVRKAYQEHAKQTLLLIDSTKFEISCFHQSLPFEKIDYILSDQPLPKDLQNIAEKKDVECIY
ncbi:DeoR/GlpR family DNA-binding transcription regulator [Garciella nitratireducens]|uniref:Transcriptional regulator, DeoR family n=1 Tax=Garciella nitratireducens DSM 15102 TaxID=1121911 RepID=A0A1T4PBJ6_9FIRM|nr:DeoR/GlpR family DNA-binding transcription regulator [Garciella nitratireducens]RBP42249.1 DeoR family transcriptional regulator [Garciella nitratireducens]SJZ88198.1 transcriptional regulator, DeoR family [Garciella nitratireducens DSM 15102]